MRYHEIMNDYYLSHMMAKWSWTMEQCKYDHHISTLSTWWMIESCETNDFGSQDVSVFSCGSAAFRPSSLKSAGWNLRVCQRICVTNRWMNNMWKKTPASGDGRRIPTSWPWFQRFQACSYDHNKQACTQARKQRENYGKLLHNKVEVRWNSPIFFGLSPYFFRIAIRILGLPDSSCIVCLAIILSSRPSSQKQKQFLWKFWAPPSNNILSSSVFCAGERERERTFARLHLAINKDNIYIIIIYIYVLHCAYQNYVKQIFVVEPQNWGQSVRTSSKVYVYIKYILNK